MSAFIDGITIGGIEIQPEAGARFFQSYVNRRVSTDHLMGDGSISRQTLAGTDGKLTTRITGRGIIPLGLQGIDTKIPQTLKCSAPLSVASASNVIDIPAARRGDSGYEPAGFAIVGGRRGIHVNSDERRSGDPGGVSGATAYYVTYYPQITALIDIDEQALDAGNAEYSFSITGTEV
ncbi:MAG: hypothetical protein H6966_09810 [Chromatiaceae bacterium]|nr:hypothetical protein [Chromatiaceae bacterium]